MTWTKHPDSHPDDLWALSDAAYRLHDHATIWSNRMLTDGFIPDARVRVLVPRFSRGALRELLDASLWRAVEGGYLLLDFAAHQPSRADVLGERERWAEVKRRTRAARNQDGSGISPAGTTGESPGIRPGGTPRRGPNVPSRTRPGGSEVVPPSLSGSPEGTSERDDWSGLPPGFREAWNAVGLRRPPTPDQTALLGQAIRDWPGELVNWLAEVPEGAGSFAAVQRLCARLRAEQQHRRAAAERAEREVTARQEAEQRAATEAFIAGRSLTELTGVTWADSETIATRATPE